MSTTSSPVRIKSLIQGRELAVPGTRPPSLRELMFDAANLCTILAILFDMFAIAATLRDQNIHLAIALGQLSAMYARTRKACSYRSRICLLASVTQFLQLRLV
jgi:hypothetical protein